MLTQHGALGTLPVFWACLLVFSAAWLARSGVDGALPLAVLTTFLLAISAWEAGELANSIGLSLSTSLLQGLPGCGGNSTTHIVETGVSPVPLQIAVTSITKLPS